MKPFNLEEALAGKPVVTRGGRKITDLHYFRVEDNIFPIYANIEGYKTIDRFTIDGLYDNMVTKHPKDLFMISEEKWTNIYWDDVFKRVFNAGYYYSEEQAKNHIVKNSNFLRSLKIEL